MAENGLKMTGNVSSIYAVLHKIAASIVAMVACHPFSKDRSMKISAKLKIMAASSIAALVLVGGLGYNVAQQAHTALGYTNGTTVPGMQALFKARSAQQDIAIFLYRHVNSSQPEQYEAVEKSMENAVGELNAGLKEYENYASSDKDREMIAAEKNTAATYLSFLPTVLEKSRNGDKAGSLEIAREMARNRDILARQINEHVRYDQSRGEEAAKAAEKDSSKGNWLMLVITLASSMLIAAISLVVVRGINRSVGSMQGAIARIEGDLDFTVRAEVIGSDEIAKVSDALNRLVEKLRSSLVVIAASASEIGTASQQLAQVSTQVAAASAQQSDSASSAAASVEEMTVSIAHVSDRSGEAHALSTESGRCATEGEIVIAQTVEDINQIAESVELASRRISQLESSSEQIASIVAVIREVAEQTNLLALNAAIEAARAGEQGRGFAVVADEVRKLAERTSTSTQEIATTIGSIRNVSRDAAESMERAVEYVSAGVHRAIDASAAVKRISDASQRAVVMVEEITAAIREQSQTSNMISGNVESIAQMAEESSAAAKNSADSAHHLDSIAKQMASVVAAYRL